MSDPSSTSPVHPSTEQVARRMRLLTQVGDRVGRQQPFAGLTIALRLHLEPKTAALIRTLARGGAHVVAMGNEGTTVRRVVDGLRRDGIEVIGRHDDDTYATADAIRRIGARRPHLVVDNGAEVIEHVVETGHQPRGATEETTSGATRLRAQLAGDLDFPVIVINDSPLKSIAENQHGVGQSVVHAIVQATNEWLVHKRLVVFGYGWCGRGIAHYARQQGARVTVVEPDEIRALDAHYAGFDIRPALTAIQDAEIVVTATGAHHVVTLGMIRSMPPEVLLVNAGHVDDEIDVAGIHEASLQAVDLMPDVRRHRLPFGTIDLVADGRIANLATSEGRGNAIASMDVGFTLQVLALERLAASDARLSPGPQAVPDDINRWTATRVIDLARPAAQHHPNGP